MTGRAGGGDWWPAEDFEEPWPDYAAMTAVDAGPAAGLDPGLDAGFLPRDAVPGQQGRAGSGFTSGHAFDTSLPGPALAARAGRRRRQPGRLQEPR